MRTDGIIREARFSKSGDRRFLLTRRWTDDEAAPYVLFVMLNPSTANAEKDDPTIRKCMKYAREWGYGALHVVNLFDFITPSPNRLLQWALAQQENERAMERKHPSLYLGIIRSESEAATITVCGWGAWGDWFPERARLVHSVLTAPHALRITHAGHPGHPLYLPAAAQPMAFQLPVRP